MIRFTKPAWGALLLLAALPVQAGEFLPATESPIPGRYLVLLRDGVARKPDMPAAPGLSVAEVAHGLAMFHGGTVGRVWEHALQGFVLEADEGRARALAADRRVELVEQDRWLAPFATQSFVHWGLDRIDERNLPRNNHFTYTNTGAGVNIYVIDSGINPDAEFGGRKVDAFTTVLDANGNPQHGDCFGHGTNVAKLAGGATSGVAKSATLRAVRVGSSCSCPPSSGSNPVPPPLFASSGCGFAEGDIISGINWVAANRIRPAVANLSLGGNGNAMVDTAVRGMHNAGVTVVAAAGNSGVDACGISPARVTEALTVGASDINDSRAFFSVGSSNIGSCLDLFAPGKDINNFGGTSAAAPLVAGAAAQYLQTNTLASPATVASYIVNNASTGKLTNVGTGSPNRLLFVPPGGTETDNPPTAAGTCTCNDRTCTFNSQSTDDFAISSCRWNVDENIHGLPIYKYGCSNVVYTYPYVSDLYGAELRAMDDGNQSRFAEVTCQ